MRLIIAGGGTGGHLFPGVAVAEEMVARGSAKDEILFVGTARGIEARAIPKEGFPLALIDVGGIKGGGVGGLFRGLLRLPHALFQALAILGRHRPRLVIGVGGYASGPMVAAAWLRGVPTAILEQNSVPGITNRILGRLVRRVFASFEESRRFFPQKKFVLLGNPIRAQLRAALAAAGENSASSISSADAATHKSSLLILGGSQGARAVNQLVADALTHLRDTGALAADRPLAGLRVVHQSGAADAESLTARYAALAPELCAEVRPFIDDMAAAYAAADLIVARAGATTLAELTAIGRPALLIPLPTAADDHQTVNARSLSDRGAALLLPQKEATGASLAAAVESLLSDPPRRARMSAAARMVGRPEAAAAIVEQLAALAQN